MEKSEPKPPTRSPKDMISKKHLILFKAENDFVNREQKGEEINFNFSFRRPISVDRSPYSPNSPLGVERHHPSFFFRRFSSKELNFLAKKPRKHFADQSGTITTPSSGEEGTPSPVPGSLPEKKDYELDAVVHKPGKEFLFPHFPARVDDNSENPCTDSDKKSKKTELEVFTDFDKPKILVSVPCDRLHGQPIVFTPSSPFKPAFFTFTKTSPRTPKTPTSPKTPPSFSFNPASSSQYNSGPVALNTRKRKRFQALGNEDSSSNTEPESDNVEKMEESQHQPETDKPAKKSRTSKKSAVGQTICCIIGCSKPVTNRLRFSLRTQFFFFSFPFPI